MNVEMALTEWTALIVVSGEVSALDARRMITAADELLARGVHRVAFDLSCAVVADRETEVLVDALAARRGEGVTVTGARAARLLRRHRRAA